MTMMLMIAALASQDVTDQDRAEMKDLKVGAGSIYMDCIKTKALALALALDDGREGVEVLARAGVTSCKADRERVILTATVWDAMTRGGSPSSNSSVAERIAANVEKQTVDTTVVALLGARKARVR